MRTTLRVVALAAPGLALLALAAVYGISEWRLQRRHEVPLLPLRNAAPADAVAGEHLARLVGCWAGCHGHRGEGGIEVIEGIRRITAPTLAQVVPQYSDAELARLVRYGVKRDGRGAAGMNAGVLWALGDQDLADIIAHLRRQPSRTPVPRTRELTLRGRIGLAIGDWQVSADQVDTRRPRWGELPRRDAFERGRYLASLICSECHGLDFDGNALEGGPSLAILALYSGEHFRTLLRTGKPIGGRDIPQMDWMPGVGFTDEEISDLYVFLRRHHRLDGTANADGPA